MMPILSFLLDSLLNYCAKQRLFIAVFDAYFEWAKLKYTQVTHNSTIGRALAYSLNQEEYLRTLLNYGKVLMDNNYAEQAIRPFTIARKNFVLIDPSKGATSSAILFSLAETAKVNGLNAYQSLSFCLQRFQSTWRIIILTFSMI